MKEKEFDSRSRIFHITEEDIAFAIARDSEACPITQAIYRTLPDVKYVQTDLATIRWSDPVKRKRLVFLTPQSARQFIIDFDKGDRAHVRSFSFRLQAPVQIVDMQARPGRDRAAEWQRTKEKQTRQKSTVIINSSGGTTQIGGKVLPTTGNSQRIRKYGLRALKR